MPSGIRLFKKISLYISILFLSSPCLAEVQSSMQLEVSKASLVSETNEIAPGKPFQVGIVLEHKDDWHSYWENPGDAGLATSFTWTLPEGFNASPIDWPPPERFLEGPLAVYGYKNHVFLPVTITPPATLTADTYPITVKADWLTCHEICIPETATLTIDLKVADALTPSENAAHFETHRKAKPTTFIAPASYTETKTHLTLSIFRTDLPARIDSALFMPRQENILLYAPEQKMELSNAMLTLTIERAEMPIEGEISGLLRIESGGDTHYFDIHFAPSSAPPAPKENASVVGLPTILLFALLGGLILNLMPCVLPVLSLKALAIAKKVGREKAHIRTQGLAYSAGVLVSFGAIAGLLITLQQSGQAVGWGYQMQSPAFVGFLIFLLFLVGLNLSGWFELPVLLGNVGNEMANETSARGSFLTGILATAVATPCTAPFMASAVGVALTLPPLQAMLVFECLGLGLALPFLLISFFPALLKFLPKPGPWMERLKHILAIPMYLSVLWLLWVLTMQTGLAGMAVVVGAMMFIAIAIYTKKHSALILLLIMAVSLPVLSHFQKNQVDMHAGEMPYSKEVLAELRAAGKPVFVDATAAWCITCQVNKNVIKSDEVRAAFADKGVTFMVADWTLRDDAISEFLRGFGYQGVPLYVYFPAHGEPIILPQLLTKETVINTIQGE